MKLYTNRFAPSPRRVRMCAAEKGITLTLVEVDLAARAHEAAEYLAVNPRAELPTLELDDGTRLVESLAICRYFEELEPEPNLFGRDRRERAAINGLVDALMFHLYLPTTHVFRHTHRFWADRLVQVPAWGELQRAAVLAEYATLDRTLADRAFLVGDRLTMADILAFTSIEFGKPSGLRPGADQAHLRRYLETIGARPSARA